MVVRELSFSRLEYGVHDRLHIYPLCGVFYFPWHRHQIEGTNGFYCLILKTERFTISNVESQVFTPNNSRLPRGLNAGGPRAGRVQTECPTTGPRRLSLRTATHFHDRQRTVGHGGMNNVRRMNDLVAVRHMKLMKLNVLSIKKLLS